jgi:hypothetical protein
MASVVVVAVMPVAMAVIPVAMAVAVAGAARVDHHHAGHPVVMPDGVDNASRQEGGCEDSAHGGDTRDGRKRVQHRSSPRRPDGALVTHNGAHPPAVDRASVAAT